MIKGNGTNVPKECGPVRCTATRPDKLDPHPPFLPSASFRSWMISTYLALSSFLSMKGCVFKMRVLIKLSSQDKNHGRTGEEVSSQ